jgi:hypothetical protein
VRPRPSSTATLRVGAHPTYQLVFHLVDRLVGRTGFASVRAYFGSFRESIDPAAIFEAAFAVSLEDFAREIAREGVLDTCAEGDPGGQAAGRRSQISGSRSQ